MSSPVLVKTLVLGASGAGKTAFGIVVKGEALPDTIHATVGIDFREKDYQVAAYAAEPAGTEVAIKARIWDTSGQERYRSITEAYGRGTAIMFLAYDMTKSETLNDAWLDFIKEQKPSLKVLLGFKADLADAKQVATADAQKFADDEGFDLFFEVSNTQGTSAVDAFKRSLQRLLEKVADGEVEYPALDTAPGVVEARKRKEAASTPPAKYTQGPYFIMSMKTLWAISFTKDDKAAGSTAGQAPVNFGMAQEFNLVPAGGTDPTEFFIKNTNSGLVLDVDAKAGSAVKQAEFTGADTQKFKLMAGGSGSFCIRTAGGLSLEAGDWVPGGQPQILAQPDARNVGGAQYWKDYVQQRFRFLGAVAPQSKM